MKQEVIAFSASGFRDFTRISASDPTMWRDIFLNNKEAVLEGLQFLIEDLIKLQNAIAEDDGDTLFDTITRARTVRRSLAAPNQVMPRSSKNS